MELVQRIRLLKNRNSRNLSELMKINYDERGLLGIRTQLRRFDERVEETNQNKLVEARSKRSIKIY